MYNVITQYSLYSYKKQHVSANSSRSEMLSLCGKNLGFDFGLKTITGFLGAKAKEYTKEQILKESNMCKTCLKKLT